MSRLTASPFNKPKAFEFPRAPLSPPDTNPDLFMAGTPMLSSAQSLAGQDYISAGDAGLASSGTDTPGARLRKTSSIPYHNSGFRDSKERSSQRIGKALIIVIPPPTLLQEHEQHGHTLTNGPFHRLSQGVVMPLLPSMFAQLTAIAREFSFPSTSGLCLYYHYIEDGLTLTPRISDDSWQTLWGHLSEPLLANERRPLISGKIEFDVDHRVARWYQAWVSSIHREISDANHYYPSTAPSLSHYRAESRTTVPDGRLYDDDNGENSVIVQRSAPITRHVPRKLSLVERFETSSVRPDIKSAPRSIASPPESFPSTSQVHTLSPIVQEEEPKTARQDLNSRVKSWRASAVLIPTPLAATGQTSLEPANLPNGMDLDDDKVQVEELRMENFTWSISSAGPQSCGSMSPLPLAWGRVPSVHLDRRLEGSVCSTPSIQTSNGPSDYDPLSPMSSGFARVPSPDIALRYFEDVPATPMTATSWGAPLSYPPSPQLQFARIPTPDIAHRFYEDAPPIPMTGTSWGAPLSYPPSPRCISPVPSLDLGERSRFGEFDTTLYYPRISDSTSQASNVWTHVWPYSSAASRSRSSQSSISSTSGSEISHDKHIENWPHVWPYNINDVSNFKPSSLTMNSRSQSTALSMHHLSNWQHVWPYTSGHAHRASSEGLTSLPPTQVGYPYLDIYADVYPYNLYSIYKPVIRSDISTAPPVDEKAYPHHLANIYPSVTRRLDLAVYPHNLSNIYSPVAERERGVSYTDARSYPHNLTNIYPSVSLYSGRPRNIDKSVYPHNLDNIYPSTSSHRRGPGRHVDMDAYPHNLANIYPFMTMARQSVDMGAYPHNLANIYPSVYPYNLTNIYPPIVRQSVNLGAYPHNLTNTYPPIAQQSVDLNAYPHNRTNIYPPNARQIVDWSAYPHNLANIYPPISRESVDWSAYPHNLAIIYPPIGGQSLDLSAYPHNLANIYPLVARRPIDVSAYPDNLANIYPSVSRPAGVTTQRRDTSAYPLNLANIYPVVDADAYPHNLANIYSVIVRPGQNRFMQDTFVEYPFFDLYPSTTSRIFAHYTLHMCNPKGQYPDFEIYPDISSGTTSKHAEPSQLPSDLVAEGWRSQVVYPTFNLYPAIYPFFDLYPSIEREETGLSQEQRDKLSVALPHAYPFFNIYPSIYPNLDIYPGTYGPSWITTVESIGHGVSLTSTGPLSRVVYPYFDIYPAQQSWTNAVVYPFFNLYPPIIKHLDSSTPDHPSVRAIVRYPIFNLYPAVYPYFDLYPSLFEGHPSAQEKKPKLSSRLTHAELHAMVMMESAGSMSFSENPSDNNAFGNESDTNRRIPNIRENHEKGSRMRPGISVASGIARPSSAIQSHDVRRQSLFKSSPDRSPSRTFSTQTSSASSSLRPQPSYSLSTRPSSVVQPRSILRSPSLRDSPSPKPSNIVPAKVPAPRRRDSLVLQRAKAYDSNVETTTGLSKETLAKFPMPPRMPMPPLPADRGK